jgi:hypothetical protein
MTLNKLVEIITQMGNDHEIIATTYYGPAMEKLAEAEVSYPMFTFDTTGGNIFGSSLTLTFQMFFFDRLWADRSNEQEVHSDQLQIAQDIIAQLRYPGFDFTVGDNIQVNLFTDSTPEMLAGVNVQVSLELPYVSDRCAVPTTYTYA